MTTSARTLLAAAAVALLSVGLIARLAPLADDQRTIAAISEDGYLMLTVARNVARGHALSIADGTIATNGVQPLVTWAWAGAHWLFGGERLPTIRLIIIMQLAVAVLTAILVGVLARDMFRHHPWRDAAAWLAGSFWFASPLTLRHTTNGLETGPYVLAIAAILLVDLRWQSRRPLRALVVGALLGGLFLVRNDAVFFIAAFLLADLWGSRPVAPGEARGPAISTRLWHAAVVAVSAFTVALPWLLYNVREFGHVVPVSGRAQSLNAGIGENLMALPLAAAEFAWMATPLPVSLGATWFRASVTAVVLIIVVAATLRRCRFVGLTLRRWAAILLVHSALLGAYYGAFFGAAYFLSRYLFPLSVIGVLVSCVWVLPRTRPTRIGLLVAGGLVLLVTAATVRSYQRSAVHGHSQVVEWVSAHVEPEVWVGAPQSGTLGYFHDRTINLDGKVNPQALQARRDSRLFQYIVDETEVTYLADWFGLARWMEHPETVQEETDPDLLRRHFEVVVRDPERNLVVLRRIRR